MFDHKLYHKLSGERFYSLLKTCMTTTTTNLLNYVNQCICMARHISITAFYIVTLEVATLPPPHPPRAAPGTASRDSIPCTFTTLDSYPLSINFAAACGLNCGIKLM